MFQREVLLKLPAFNGRQELYVDVVPKLERVAELAFLGWKGRFTSTANPEILVKIQTPGAVSLSAVFGLASTTAAGVVSPGGGIFITPVGLIGEQQGSQSYGPAPQIVARNCGDVSRIQLLVTDFAGSSTLCISDGPLYLRFMATCLPAESQAPVNGGIATWGTVGDGTIVGAPRRVQW